MNTVILIAHDEVVWDEVEFDEYAPIKRHFAKCKIEADPYMGNTSRLLWKQPQSVSMVRNAIVTSPLFNVSVAKQDKWCDAEFANKLADLLAAPESKGGAQ